MADIEDINVARYKLVESLGDESKRYFERLKLWFKMKITKEEFDLESRKLMNPQQIHLHNQFLLCFFNKCQGLAQDSTVKRGSQSSSIAVAPPTDSSEGATSPSEKGKKVKLGKKRVHGEIVGFQPVEVIDYLPSLQQREYKPNDEPQRSCAHELFLPDQSFIMGRLMIAAWERGLDDVNSSAADYLVCAVQHFLKGVLISIFSQRSAFKLQSKTFVHAVGAPISNPWLRNAAYITNFEGPTETEIAEENKNNGKETAVNDEQDSVHVARLRSSLQDIEEKKILEEACSIKSHQNQPPVTVWNLLDALQTHKSAIMSQTVYSINLERILTKLGHPSWEDEEAALARAGQQLISTT